MKLTFVTKTLIFIVVALLGRVKGATVPQSKSFVSEITELAMYARITYVNKLKTIKNWSCGGTCKMARVKRAKLIYTAESRVAILVQPASMKNTTVLAFRGTKSHVDWFRNLQANTVKVSFCGRQSKVTIHKGFSIVYQDFLERHLWRKVQRFMKITNSNKLIITGHSLGGALATIAACAAKSKLEIPNLTTKLVTFGSPRVGEIEFVDAVAKAADSWYRVAYYGDPVAYVPTWSTTYKYVHGGKYIPLVKTEICMSKSRKAKESVIPTTIRNDTDFTALLPSFKETHCQFCNFKSFFQGYDGEYDTLQRFPKCKLTDTRVCEKEEKINDSWPVFFARSFQEGLQYCKELLSDIFDLF